MIVLNWSKITSLLELPDLRIIFKQVGLEYEESLLEGMKYVEFDMPTNEKFFHIPTFILRATGNHQYCTKPHTPIKEIKLLSGFSSIPYNVEYAKINFDNCANYVKQIYQLAFVFNQQIHIINDSIIFSRDTCLWREQLGIKEKMDTDWWYTEKFLNELKRMGISFEIIELNSDIYCALPISLSDIADSIPYIKYSIESFKPWSIISDTQVPRFMEHLSPHHIYELINMNQNVVERPYSPQIQNIGLEYLTKIIQNALEGIGIPNPKTDEMIVPLKRYPNLAKFFNLRKSKNIVQIKSTNYFLRTDLTHGLLKYLGTEEQTPKSAFDIGDIFYYQNNKLISQNVLTIIISYKEWINNLFVLIHDLIITKVTYKSLYIINEKIYCHNVWVGDIQYFRKELLDQYGLQNDFISVCFYISKLHKVSQYVNREQILMMYDSTIECSLLLNVERIPDFFKLLNKYAIRYRTLSNGYQTKDNKIKLNVLVYKTFYPQMAKLIKETDFLEQK